MGVGVSRPRQSHSLAFAVGSPASLVLPRSPRASVPALTRSVVTEGRHFSRRAVVLYCHPDDIPATVALVQAARRLATLQPTRLIVVRHLAADGSWPVALLGHDGTLRPYPFAPLGDPGPLVPPVHERDGAPVYTLASPLDARPVLHGWHTATLLGRTACRRWSLVADAALPVLIGAMGALPAATTFRWARWGRRLVPLLSVDPDRPSSAPTPAPARRLLL